jgi:hypothetical protein
LAVSDIFARLALPISGAGLGPSRQEGGGRTREGKGGDKEGGKGRSSVGAGIKRGARGDDF